MNYPLLISRVDAVRDFLWKALDNSYKLIRWTPMLVLLRVWGESDMPTAGFGQLLYYVVFSVIGVFLFAMMFSHYLKDSPDIIFIEEDGRIAVKIFFVVLHAGAAGMYLFYMIYLIGFFSDFIQDVRIK